MLSDRGLSEKGVEVGISRILKDKQEVEGVDPRSSYVALAPSLE